MRITKSAVTSLRMLKRRPFTRPYVFIACSVALQFLEKEINVGTERGDFLPVNYIFTIFIHILYFVWLLRCCYRCLLNDELHIIKRYRICINSIRERLTVSHETGVVSKCIYFTGVLYRH